LSVSSCAAASLVIHRLRPSKLVPISSAWLKNDRTRMRPVIASKLFYANAIDIVVVKVAAS
jgi:hypothetical protein